MKASKACPSWGALPGIGASARLLRAEEPVAGVAEAGQDVPVLVQLAVERGGEDGDVGVRGVQAPDALGGGDQEAEKRRAGIRADLAAAARFLKLSRT